jgi:hypothetical protein
MHLVLLIPFIMNTQINTTRDLRVPADKPYNTYIVSGNAGAWSPCPVDMLLGVVLAVLVLLTVNKHVVMLHVLVRRTNTAIQHHWGLHPYFKSGSGAAASSVGGP